MRLFTSELRKLMASRFIILLFAVLLAANFALAMISTHAIKSKDVIIRVFDEYVKNPDEFDAYYDELEAIILASPFDEDLVLPHTYDSPDGGDDYGILRVVRQRYEYFDTLNPTIEKIIRQTEQRISDLHSYGYSDKTYTTGSQIASLERYQKLLGTVELVPEVTCGYDQYFQYQLVTVFLLLFVTAVVSNLFLCDNTIGARPIMHSTKHGRLATAAAKLCVSLAVDVVATVAFLGTTLLAVGIKMGGFSSPFSPIQNFADFIAVPANMTVLEYMMLQGALRLCAVMVFSLIIAALAAARLPYAVCFGGGIVVSAINCALFYYPYLGTAPTAKYFNLASMCDGNAMMRYYRTVSFFKKPVSMTLALFITCLIVGLLIAAAASVCFCRLNAGNLRLFRRLGAFSRRVIAQMRPKAPTGRERSRGSYPANIAAFELFKMRPLIVLCVSALMLTGRGLYVDRALGNFSTYGEALYHGYIERIQSLDSTGRQEFFAAERERIDGVIDKNDEMTALYMEGKITDEAYYAYQKDFYHAQDEEPTLERLESYVRYIDRKSAETGRDVRVIYSTGYERFFGMSADVFLFLAIVFICYRAFAMEYSAGGGFAQLLMTLKRGRRPTFRVKILLYLLLSAFLSILFRVVDVAVAASKFSLADLDAPLCSVEQFSAVSGTITIGQYMVLCVVLSVLSAVVITVAVLALSMLVKREFAILTLALLAFGVPELVVLVLLPGISELSVLGLTASSRIVRRSAEVGMFSRDFGYLLVICVVIGIAAAALTTVSRKKFVR